MRYVFADCVLDTATLAAALQEYAAPGTILCSNTTARLIQTAVDVEALGLVLVGGQSVPVMAYKVLGKQLQSASVAPHKARPWSRFIGRSRELATVGTLLARVEDGQGHVVGIMGDAGIGKSRLLDEFRQRLRGRRLTYLRGRCLSYGGATPYLPVLDLLRHHCSMTEVDRPEVITVKVSQGLQEVGMAPQEWAPYLLHLLGLEPGVEHLARLDPQTVKARTFEALVQLSIHSSRQRPLVLEVEDLHWIDATSEEWLATLVERIAGVPILMLVSYRPGYRARWMDKSYATQLTLRQLTRRDSQQVLQTVLHTEQVSAALTQAILAKADGNPFFLEELARTVVEQGVWRLSLAVPDTIHAVLAARIDRLPLAQKNLLQAAAVIGQDVTLPLLQTLVGLSEEDMQRGLRALQAAEFVYETRLVPVPTYTFKHVLTQEVAYQSLLHSTRTQYHRQIAQVVEEQLPDLAAAQPELVAHHYTEAGLNVQAVAYWQRAGEHSNARSAYMEAVAHCTTGLALLQTLPDTPARTRHELEMQLTLSRALQVTKGSVAPERGHTLARAQELCRQVGNTPQLLRVLGGLAEFYLMQGNLRTARELAEQRLTLTEGQSEPAFRMRAHVDMGALLFYLGELALAQAHLAQALALAVAQQNGSLVVLADEDAMVRCLGYAARVLWKLGYPDQALTRSHEMLTYAQASSHTFTLLRALYYAALIHMGRREGAAAQQQAEAALTLMTEQGFGFNFDYATFARGWALAAQGQRQEGIVQMRQGLATNRAMGVLLGETWSLVPLAEAYGACGQAEDGLRLVAEALAYVDHTGERFYEAEVYRLKGKLLLLQTVPDELQAEACFHQALAVARHQQAKLWELRTAMSLSRLWQEQGKRTEARRLLAPVYDWFTEGFDTVDLQEARALLEELWR